MQALLGTFDMSFVMRDMYDMYSASKTYKAERHAHKGAARGLACVDLVHLGRGRCARARESTSIHLRANV